MFTPASADVALPMMFLMWFCWGSWPSLRKQGGSLNEHFGLTYMLAQVLITLFYCFTLGMLTPEATHFDQARFVDLLAKDMSEKSVAFAVAFLGGVICCSGDFVMAKSIELLGVAIASPTGMGLAMLYGTAASYAIEPKADAALLFTGLATGLVGMLCDAASKMDPKRSPAEPVAEDSTPSKDPEAAVEDVQLGTASTVESAETAPPAQGKYAVLLPVLGGLMIGSMGPINTVASTAGELTPYSQLFAFMMGGLFAIGPVVCTYMWLSRRTGEGESQSLLQIPHSLSRSYLKASGTRPRAVMWNALAGMCVGTGYFLFFVGTPVVSKAVGTLFGTSSLLLSVLLGVFFFKELHGKSLKQKVLCATCVVCLSTSLALMCAASLKQ